MRYILVCGPPRWRVKRGGTVFGWVAFAESEAILLDKTRSRDRSRRRDFTVFPADEDSFVAWQTCQQEDHGKYLHLGDEREICWLRCSGRVSSILMTTAIKTAVYAPEPKVQRELHVYRRPTSSISAADGIEPLVSDRSRHSHNVPSAFQCSKRPAYERIPSATRHIRL